VNVLLLGFNVIYAQWVVTSNYAKRKICFPV
jgi:hypothetical protein